MLRSLSLCLLTLLFGVGAYSRHDNPGKGDTCGEKVRGLRSCIWLDSQDLGARQKVLVHHKIQNVSDGEIVLWQSGFWPNNTIVVLNDRSESVKLTKEGRRNLAAFSPGGDRNKNFPVRLKSNESIDINTLDLRRFFVFASPGNYTVRFIYEEYQDGGWQGKLTSNELRFRIK
jgi:hypothetical protein